MTRHRCIALLSTLLPIFVGACGGSGATTTPGPARAEIPPARRAQLRYEMRGRAFPMPIVSGTVEGQPTLMLVDTGANSHVIAGWFARKVGLALQELGDVGTDHIGRAIQASRVEDPHVTIQGWGPLDAGPMMATEVPDFIERLGIGAFISPQRLAREGDAVILDLAHAELREASEGEAARALDRAGGSPLVGDGASHLCEEKEGAIHGLTHVLDASIDGTATRLMVDTGAAHSDLFLSSGPGKKLAAKAKKKREALYTASGKIQGRTLPSVRVSAGASSVVTDVDFIAGNDDPSCPRDGVLGMDLLRACVLVLGPRAIDGRCAAATAPGTAAR